jgi:hypothetical protein
MIKVFSKVREGIYLLKSCSSSFTYEGNLKHTYTLRNIKLILLYDTVPLFSTQRLPPHTANFKRGSNSAVGVPNGASADH